MSRKFQYKAVPSRWFYKNGYRLDCGPYMSGSIESREIIEHLNTEPLEALTSGYKGGIYNGSPFIRNYVKDPKYGVPFLTTSSMLQADHSNLPLLRAKDTTSKKLSLLEIKKNMTLITCSGSIGRMAYAREDMEGSWSNQNILKVVANDAKIKSGYLYAYLGSKFGIPQVISGTYGTIIQHIEPSNIADLPVPRLGEIEDQVHGLIQQASALLTEYQDKINGSTKLFFESVNLKNITAAEWHGLGSDLGFTAAFNNVDSLRALNFNPRFQNLCQKIKQGPWKPLKQICLSGTLKNGPRFKRIDATPEFGYQLIGQKQVFWLYPKGRWIAKTSVGKEVLVPNGAILVAAQGTLGENELFCRSEFIQGDALERAYSQHFIRIVADEEIMQRGALFAFVRSETAFRMFRSISIGSKLQDFHPRMLADLPIPFPSREVLRECNKLVLDGYKARELAANLEDKARALVEQTIEKGGR